MRAGQFFENLETVPLATLNELTAGAPFVVVAPHPDDETLGCSGLLCEARDAGRELRVVVATDGSASHPNSKAFPPARVAALRRQESIEAAQVCGVPEAWLRFLDVRDSTVPLTGEVFDAAVDAVQVVVEEIGAHSIFVTWRDDPHCDHEAVHDVVLAVALRRRLRAWAYPIWGWALPPDSPVEHGNGRRLDIDRWRDRKALAVACHRTQTTRLIDDDANGFILDAQVLSRFQGRYEYFVEARR